MFLVNENRRQFVEQKELVAPVGKPDTQYLDNEREMGTMEEIYGKCSLPEIVVPPVIQDFLNKREVQQSTGQVAFTVR